MPATADRPDHSTPSVEASLPPDPRNQAVSETGAAALKTAPSDTTRHGTTLVIPVAALDLNRSTHHP